jgi:hypothetical protein
MIRSICAALFLLLIGISPSFGASQGFVVASCPGTLGVNAYTAGQFGNITVDLNGNSCVVGNITTTPSTPAAGTVGAGYPPGATPVNASATGTTAGTTATLPAAAGKFTYICGFHVETGTATAAVTINVTVTGLTGGTFTSSANAPVTATTATAGPIISQVFTPCIPSSAVNTGLAVAAGSLGAGGVNQNVNAWGFQQ